MQNNSNNQMVLDAGSSRQMLVERNAYLNDMYDYTWRDVCFYFISFQF